MNTQAPNLAKQAPRSPRARLSGFAIALRTIDKCRADVAGTLDDYHYDCPLDNQLFSFKGIDGRQFREVVQRKLNDEDLALWLHSNGTPRTRAEVDAWSAQTEALRPYDNPEKRQWFVEACAPLGIDPKTSTLFDMLEADDRASFGSRPSAKNPDGKVQLILNT